MKKTVLFFVVLTTLISISNTYSQGIPKTINYQGVLKDAAGTIVPDGNYNIIFQFCEAETGGTVFWEELQTINVIDGILNAQLGTIAPIPLTIFENPAWLSIIINGGTPLTPRIPLTSVPYSFMSMTVPDGSLTASKIADDEVVKSLNGLKDNVSLVAGANVTITPAGNNLTISSTGGGSGIGGSGTTNYLPLFTSPTTLGTSVVYQTAAGNIGIGITNPIYPFVVGSDRQVGILYNGNDDFYSSIYVNALKGTANSGFGYLRNHVLKAYTGITTSDSWYVTTGSSNIKRIVVDPTGNVGIGTEAPLYPLHVATNRKYAGYFTTDSLDVDAHALHGEYLGSSNVDATGVFGKSFPATGYGIGGEFTGGWKGIYAYTQGPDYLTSSYAVYGISGGNVGSRFGVYGYAGGTGAGTRIGIYGGADGGATSWAGYFYGNVNVVGTLSKGGGSFKIDHPLDPTNKNLYHSFVESPDMMNIYNGNVITDGSGYATVTMPDWFEALNQEFRYQLTVIGDFAQAIVAQEIQNNQFAIRTDKANIKVSWQVTGIRHDKFAEKYRIPVEEDKTGKDVGKYLHPDAYGVSETMGVDYEHTKENKNKK